MPTVKLMPVSSETSIALRIDFNCSFHELATGILELRIQPVEILSRRSWLPEPCRLPGIGTPVKRDC